MSEEERLTAYCGLYCRDCIPSRKDLYALAASLEQLLSDLRFDKYAELKASQTYWSQASEAFNKYPDFLKVLKAIRSLECPSACREGGGYKGDRCEIKKCAVGKKLKGCWECNEHGDCSLLEPMKQFHPHLQEHLELIRAEGIEDWSRKRKGHYRWS
jgi:hypothetical protein